MKVALTCIAKDEDNYIEEWINYNLKLGFDDIFIYQHNWRCNIEKNNVHKIIYDGSYIENGNGISLQTNAYNNFIQKYHTKYDWVAFLDVDEFLVLKKHRRVKDFIEEYKNENAIGINWVFFGDNNLSFNGNHSVLHRFTKRSKLASDHVKCIVKMDPSITYAVHSPGSHVATDTHYNKFWGVTNSHKKIDIAQINHYFCKTWDEWLTKKERFMSNDSMDNWYVKYGHDDKDLYFHERNLNEVEDTMALDFYLGKTQKDSISKSISMYRKIKGGDITLVKNNDEQFIPKIKTNTNLDRVASLWVGNKLSEMEILSIQSFISNGHPYHLYVYDQIDNIPRGVIVEDANKIIPKKDIFYAPGPDGKMHLGSFSDIFRYKMLNLCGGYWVDTDAVCIKPFDFDSDYVFSSQKENDGGSLINNGIMKLPKGCEELNYCIEYCEKIENKNLIQWSTIGPRLINDLVKKYNLERYVKSPEVFMPIDWWDALIAFDENKYVDIPIDSYCVHFWGGMLSMYQIDKNKKYHPSCLFERIKRKVLWKK